MIVVEIEREPIAADRLATRTVADEEVVFLDPDGVEIEALARPMRGSRAEAQVLTFRFPKDREPARLRARVLTGAKEEAIDFSFEDVPLP
ncbi:MAG: hypothetical protein R3F20_04860 [Planctomycetota bacterium]